jgi:hypothetical protein
VGASLPGIETSLPPIGPSSRRKTPRPAVLVASVVAPIGIGIGIWWFWPKANSSVLPVHPDRNSYLRRSERGAGIRPSSTRLVA